MVLITTLELTLWIQFGYTLLLNLVMYLRSLPFAIGIKRKDFDQSKVILFDNSRTTAEMHTKLMVLSVLIPNVLGAFHLMTRYDRHGTFTCSKETCSCKFDVEWRMGAVPSNQYNCNSFKNDRYFQKIVGQGSTWNTNYPSICGSREVNMYVINGGNNLEVWEANANPGNLIVTCYKQSVNSIPCGNNGDPLCPVGSTEIHDVWVCANTGLCD